MNKQQSNTVMRINSFELDFKNELFENQFVTLYAWQKHESVKNDIDKQKKKSKIT